MTVKCSLCPQTFEEDDPLFEERKKKHELGRHTHHTVISERDGTKSKPMGNFIYGKVEWLKVIDNLDIVELALVEHDCPTMKKGSICEHGIGSIDEIKALNNKSRASGW